MNDDFIETTISSDSDFLNLAMTFGYPIQSRKNGKIIDNLISLSSDQVEKNSLSKKYGLGEFPIHTDCAYLKTPPKYILLRNISDCEKPTPTIIVHFDLAKLSEDELDFILRKIWFVKSDNNGFYSPIMKNNILRYDIEVMKLVNCSENKMLSILPKMETSKIEWKKNKVAIINNHKNLHYRPNVSQSENKRRILQRINIL